MYKKNSININKKNFFFAYLTSELFDFLVSFLDLRKEISIHIATQIGINEIAPNIKKHKPGNVSIVRLKIYANNEEAIIGAVSSMTAINVNTFPNSE